MKFSKKIFALALVGLAFGLGAQAQRIPASSAGGANSVAAKKLALPPEVCASDNVNCFTKENPQPPAPAGPRSWTSYFIGQTKTAAIGRPYNVSGSVTVLADGSVFYQGFSGPKNLGVPLGNGGVGSQLVVENGDRLECTTTAAPAGWDAFGGPPTSWSMSLGNCIFTSNGGGL